MSLNQSCISYVAYRKERLAVIFDFATVLGVLWFFSFSYHYFAPLHVWRLSVHHGRSSKWRRHCFIWYGYQSLLFVFVFGFLILWHWSFPKKVIPEKNCVYYIRYLRFYCDIYIV